MHKSIIFLIPKTIFVVLILSFYFAYIISDDDVEKVLKEGTNNDLVSIRVTDKKALKILIKNKMQSKVSVVYEINEVKSNETMIFYALDHYEINLNLNIKDNIILMSVLDKKTNLYIYDQLEVLLVN